MFLIRLATRVTHITCAMVMLLLCASPLLSKPDKDGAFQIHISSTSSVPVNSARLGMILFVLSVLSGLLNSHLLKVSETIPDRNTRLRWRTHIYFLKGMMSLSLSPVLEVLLEMFYNTAGLKGVSPADKRATAAVTRCYVTLMLAAVGSYCKVMREDAGMVVAVAKPAGSPALPAAAVNKKSQ